MGWLAGFLEKIWQATLAVWPWSIVRYLTIGVRWHRGKAPVILEPGIVRNLMMVDHLVFLEARKHWKDCPDQPLTTKDNVSLVISSQIELQITDAFVFVTEQSNPGDDIDAIVLAQITRYVTERTLAEISAKDLEQNLRPKLRDRAEKWGMKIHQFNVNKIARATNVLWHAGDGMVATLEHPEEEDE